MRIYKERNFWAAALLIFLIDQATKIWAVNFLPYDETVYLNNYFNFYRIYNEATIMLSYHLPFGLSVNQFRFFWVVMAVFITFSITMVLRQPAFKNKGWVEECAKTGLFLILGAMWGNAFDRIFRQEGVVDFLQIRISENTWPIINFADIMIYMGELALVMAWLLIIVNVFKKHVLSFIFPEIKNFKGFEG